MAKTLMDPPCDSDQYKGRLLTLESDVEQEITNGAPLLRFTKVLEDFYECDNRAVRKEQRITALIASIIFLNLSLYIDYSLLHDMFGQALIIRLGVITPFLLLVGFLVMRGLSPFYQNLVLFAASILTGFSAIYLLGTSNDPNRIFFHPSLLIILTFSNIIIRPDFWWALSSSVVVFTAYVIFYPHTQNLPPQVFFSNLTMLFFCLVITLDSNYILEHEQRLNYLLGLREKIRRTSLDSNNRRLNRLVAQDPLTRLANRREVDDFLSRLCLGRQPSHMAVIMFDIDHFKKFNDHYGHPAGDECLRAVAREMRKVIKRKTDLVGRIGGEEFIILLPDSDEKSAVRIAELVRENVLSLKMEHKASPVSPYVTISAGVTAGTFKSQTGVRTLLEAADEALYKAKAGRRNRVEVNLPSGTVE